MIVMWLHEHARALPVLRHSATARQFVRFALVGATNSAWDFLVYLVLTRGWLGFSFHYLWANSVAFFVSVTNSYILNKRWTFRHSDRRHHIHFSKFLMVNLVTLALYEVILFATIDRLRIPDIIAKLVAIALVTVWNFGANKYWTFR